MAQQITRPMIPQLVISPIASTDARLQMCSVHRTAVCVAIFAVLPRILKIVLHQQLVLVLHNKTS